MTDVNLRASSTDSRAALSALRLPELLALAGERGLVGASKLRKGELVDALSENENQNTTTVAEPVEAPISGTSSTSSESEAAPPRKRASRRATTADAEAIAARAAAAPVAEATPPAEPAPAAELAPAAEPVEA
ncbi:MAG TPA: Rho termination factor N-terminal domain-containing protein, partial [Galbitalea sp.]